MAIELYEIINKTIQETIKYVHTLIISLVTLALIGLYSIDSEIDYKKLVFLGQLCRLPGCQRVKEVFIHRLVHFNESPAKKLGLLPDIHVYRILNKYSIVHILDEYMQTGCFPNKFSRKKLVRMKINALYMDGMIMRLAASESVSRIFKIHTMILIHTHVFWVILQRMSTLQKVRTFGYSTGWVNDLWKMVFNAS